MWTRTWLLGAGLAVGCAGASPAARNDNRPLYDRLGQKPAITAVVHDFVGNVAADGRINSFFAKTDLPHLEAMLVEQICQAAGGPCVYSGKDMRTVHEGMHITAAQFDAMVEDLGRSLDKLHVGKREQNELVQALGGLKGDIIEH